MTHISNDKYETTGETLVFDGVTLHRIRARQNLSTRITAGALGGWVESEDNLAPEGLCWVGEEARVHGNARVRDSAWVFRRAEVFGNACVEGSAYIGDNARVFGDARVGMFALVTDNALVGGTAVVVYGAIEGDTWIFGREEA